MLRGSNKIIMVIAKLTWRVSLPPIVLANINSLWGGGTNHFDISVKN